MHKQNKNIAFLLPDLSGGGAERVVATLLKQIENEFNCILILFNKKIVYEIPESVEVIYITQSFPAKWKQLMFLPWYAQKLKNLLKHRNVTTCMSFMHFPNFVNACCKLLNTNTKIIVSERAHTGALLKGNNIQLIIARSLVKWLYRFADLVVPNAKQTESCLRDDFSISKLQTVYNPIDLDFIQQKAKLKVTSNPGKTSDFTFINVGRLHVNKGQASLIKAFALLANQNSRLWILGEGPEEASLKGLINELGLQSRVFLLGFQSNPYAYMAAADVFVLSSIIEGFPNVLVEAIALQKVVIAVDCPSGPREILFNKYDNDPIDELKKCPAGYLVPMDNIDLLARSMTLSQEKISDISKEHNATLLVQQYSTEAIISRYKSLFQ